MPITPPTETLRCDTAYAARPSSSRCSPTLFSGQLRPGQSPRHAAAGRPLRRQPHAHPRGAHQPRRHRHHRPAAQTAGAIVRAVTAREIREICEVRRVLECQATRIACGRLGLAELHSIGDELRWLRSQPSPIWAELIDRARAVDSRLHDLIAASCGNAFLAQELGRLKTLFRAFRDVSYVHHESRTTTRRLADEAGEHLAIVEELIRGDGRAASKAMVQHHPQRRALLVARHAPPPVEHTDVAAPPAFRWS